jgi:hypothetical protein
VVVQLADHPLHILLECPHEFTRLMFHIGPAIMRLPSMYATRHFAQTGLIVCLRHHRQWVGPYLARLPTAAQPRRVADLRAHATRCQAPLTGSSN